MNKNEILSLFYSNILKLSSLSEEEFSIAISAIKNYYIGPINYFESLLDNIATTLKDSDNETTIKLIQEEITSEKIKQYTEKENYTKKRQDLYNEINTHLYTIIKLLENNIFPKEEYTKINNILNRYKRNAKDIIQILGNKKTLNVIKQEIINNTFDLKNEKKEDLINMAKVLNPVLNNENIKNVINKKNNSKGKK